MVSHGLKAILPITPDRFSVFLRVLCGLPWFFFYVLAQVVRAVLQLRNSNKPDAGSNPAPDSEGQKKQKACFVALNN